MKVYIEAGVGGHIDNATQAWTFEPTAWGRCGQGHDEASALADLVRQLETVGLADCIVVERVRGDEQAFTRDREPVRPIERELTKRVLATSRAHTIDVLNGCSPAELDWVDPDRRLPAWATWHSLRAMAWHVLETESGYYLPRIGIDSPLLSTDLMAELEIGVDRIASAIDDLPVTRFLDNHREQWTPTKVLRRLAWHERAELVAIKELAAKAHRALA